MKLIDNFWKKNYVFSFFFFNFLHLKRLRPWHRNVRDYRFCASMTSVGKILKNQKFAHQLPTFGIPSVFWSAKYLEHKNLLKLHYKVWNCLDSSYFLCTTPRHKKVFFFFNCLFFVCWTFSLLTKDWFYSLYAVTKDGWKIEKRILFISDNVLSIRKIVWLYIVWEN